MLDVVSYKEITDGVRQYSEQLKNIDVFEVAQIVKPLRDEVLEDALKITWEQWDGESWIGLQSPVKIKEYLEPDQVVFILKEGEYPLASYSRAQSGKILTQETIREEAERFVTAYRTEYMRRRLISAVVDALVERRG